jgi:hypothetical protein
MAASVVGICNSALLKIGSERINSLGDDNKRAIACNEQWEKVRDEVLSDHPWNFATKRAALAQLDSTPAWGYAYEFQLPDDCLRVIGTQYPGQDYKIEGRKVLTDETELNILYIYRNEEPAYWSPKFCEAMALRLASDLAYHIAQSATLAQGLYATYQALLSDAKIVDAQEGSPSEMIVTEWLDVRL